MARPDSFLPRSSNGPDATGGPIKKHVAFGGELEMRQSFSTTSATEHGARSAEGGSYKIRGTLAKTKQNCVLWTIGFHFGLMDQYGPMFLQLLLASTKLVLTRASRFGL